MICRTKSGTCANRQQATGRQERHGSRQTCATDAVKCRSDFVMDALNNGKQVQLCREEYRRNVLAQPDTGDVPNRDIMC